MHLGNLMFYRTGSFNTEETWTKLPLASPLSKWYKLSKVLLHYFKELGLLTKYHSRQPVWVN